MSKLEWNILEIDDKKYVQIFVEANVLMKAIDERVADFIVTLPDGKNVGRDERSVRHMEQLVKQCIYKKVHIIEGTEVINLNINDLLAGKEIQIEPHH